MESALNLYERQKTLLPNIPEAVGIVGVGGVGSWLAYFLALAGVPELWLWDHDTVSDNNLNRLPLPQSAIGEPKTEALYKVIVAARPEATVYCFGEFTPAVFDAMDLSKLGWLVAGTDSLKSRRLVADSAQKHYIAYLELAAEGEVGSVTFSPADFATPEEEQPGYRSVPVWVGPCTMAASIASAHILHGVIGGDSTYRTGWNLDTRLVEMACLSPTAAAVEAIPMPQCRHNKPAMDCIDCVRTRRRQMLAHPKRIKPWQPLAIS
jgi:molybdopterin/thiamine biosynthesis adenylyltransferase